MEEVNIAKVLNDLARHRMISRIYSDILADLQVCKIEGWDCMEYIAMLKNVIDHFVKEHERYVR